MNLYNEKQGFICSHTRLHRKGWAEYMKKGDYIYTPRFCTVRIEKVFEDEESARASGFKEPTHYADSEYGIRGKSLNIRQMKFAAYKK